MSEFVKWLWGWDIRLFGVPGPVVLLLGYATWGVVTKDD